MHFLRRSEEDAGAESTSGAGGEDDIERLAHEALQKDVDGRTDAELAAHRAAWRAEKAARRKSLRGYVPVKRELSSDLSRAEDSSCVDAAGAGAGNSSMIGAAVAATQRERRIRPLRGLMILVDVRAQDGEDASGKWVDLLKKAGAKVYVRPPALEQRGLTHIVYKSGRPATLHAFRNHKDPKPFVVGVQWVLTCVEQDKRVNEEPYLIEVGKEAVFQKVRVRSASSKERRH